MSATTKQAAPCIALAADLFRVATKALDAPVKNDDEALFVAMAMAIEAAVDGLMTLGAARALLSSDEGP